jgi:peptide/nickel transport system substrate-binding protein
MNDKKRNLGRVALYATVIGAMAISLIPAGARSASAQGNTRKIGDFDVAGRFLEVWSAQGNDQADTYLNGLPITTRRSEISTENGTAYDTQWFERAKYEAHPENKAPYDVLLGRLGAFAAEGRGSIDGTTGKVRNPADQPFVGIDKPADADGKTKAWFQETKHSISGKLLTYFNQYGGIAQWGFPLSEAFNEPSTDGKTYLTQYFERVRAEVHPEKADPYGVELTLLGVTLYKATPVAAANLPIAPPKGVTSSKDTIISATAQEPGSLYLLEEGTVTAVRHTWPITFNDGLVGQTDKETFFPLAAWYVPTIENGGSFYAGNGDDRHLVVKYKLRKGIKWSDGVELTSQDAVFAGKYILDDPNTGPPQIFLKLSNIDNPDKYTVLYNFLSVNQAKAILADKTKDQNLYDFLNVFVQKDKPVTALTYFSIGTVLPQHVLSKIDPTKVQDSSFARAPIGYGPFVVDHWTSGVEMLFKKNPNYNLTDPPLFSNYLIKEGVALASAYQQIASGAIDDISGEAILVPPPNAADLTAAGVNIISIPAESWEHLDFNFNFGPFKDKAVRQAIAMATNKQQIIDVVYAGKATAMNSPVPPLSRFSLDSPTYAKDFPAQAAKYLGSFPKYSYDIAGANKLLDDAGWVKGADGIRAKGGQQLKFEYASTNNPTRIQIMTLNQNSWKQIGVQADIKNYTAGEYFDPQGPINKGVCKICQFAYDQTSFDGFLPWDKTQIVTEDNPNLSNRQAYSSDAVTAASQDFDSSLSDTDVADASARAQTGMMTDIAVIPMITRLHIELIRNNFMNFKETINSSPQTWSITQWYIK